MEINMIAKIKGQKGGYILTIVAIMFIAISMALLFGIVNPVIAQIKNSNRAEISRQSYYIAEAATEDVLYRLKNNIPVSSSETLSFAGGTAEVSITDSFDGKTILTESDYKNTVRKINTKVIVGTGASFSYAIQSGNGGFYISGNSTISGSVFSNGNIIGDSGTITGSASAASVSNSIPNQANNSPETPQYDYTFGSSNNSQDVAQSFQVSEASALSKVRFYMKKTGNPSNITVRVAFDNGSGAPSSNGITGVIETLSSGVVGTSYGWVDVVFGNQILLQPGVTYWLVLDKANNTNTYTIGAGNPLSYQPGKAMVGRFGSTWYNTTPNGLVDIYFEIYSGSTDSKIEGVGGSWDLTVGEDSSANQVNKTNTAGILYCQNGTDNADGKTCNTSRVNPAPQELPISDSLIQTWKTDVSMGIQNSDSWEQTGSMTVNYLGITKTDPLKVNGNLTLSCNSDKPATFNKLHVTGNVTVGSGCTFVVLDYFKINGSLTLGSGVLSPAATVWVGGNISVSGGGKVQLHSNYGSNSGIVISDGRISLAGNGEFAGSGISGSFPLLVTTSVCPVDPSCSGNPALAVSGGAGAVVLIAPYGTLSLNGGSAAKSMVAHRIEVSGGGTINYETGLIDLTFSSGPSGGWNISSWKEIE